MLISAVHRKRISWNLVQPVLVYQPSKIEEVGQLTIMNIGTTFASLGALLGHLTIRVDLDEGALSVPHYLQADHRVTHSLAICSGNTLDLTSRRRQPLEHCFSCSCPLADDMTFPYTPQSPF